MLANSARKYLNKYGVAVGKNLVFFTNNDSAYETAIDYFQQGINVQAIVDVRSETDGHFPNKAKELGITILNGYIISNTFGRLELKEVQVKKLSNIDIDEKNHLLQSSVMVFVFQVVGLRQFIYLRNQKEK